MAGGGSITSEVIETAGPQGYGHAMTGAPFHAAGANAAGRPVGEQLRAWRQRRRLSQLALACDAEISTRHLSFLETGRARPSRDMVLRLAERLELPLRERNRMLLAAGFAPLFPERPLEDPAMAAARNAMELILGGHEPYPALAIDRRWTLVAANPAAGRLMAGAAAALLAPPVNVLRLSLHPDGLAPRTINLADWRRHVFARLQRQIDLTGDQGLAGLLDELRGYPGGPARGRGRSGPDTGGAVAALSLETAAGRLELFTTTTVFGTPVDVTLSELALESFYPADDATAARLRALAAPGE